MPTIPIANEEQLEEWLRTKPEMWARIIALRAAFRTLPLTALFFEQRTTHPETLALSTFRSAAVSWAALRYPEMFELYLERRSVAAARWGFHNLQIHRMSSRAGRPLQAAAIAAEVAGMSPKTDLRKSAAAVAAAAAACAGDNAARDIRDRPDDRAKVARIAAGEIWKAIASDAEAMIDVTVGGEVSTVLDMPLWTTDPPAWALSSLRNLARFWGGLDRNARIWTNWTSSRVYGHNSLGMPWETAREFDTRLASQSDAWWLTSPVEINDEIASWHRELWSPSERETVSSVIMNFLSEIGRPSDITEITEAFRRSDIAVIPKTVRGDLSRLASSGRIARVGHGLYAAIEVPPLTSAGEVERQTKGAIQFESHNDAPISVKHRSSVGELRSDMGAQKLHQEVRRRVDQLLSQHFKDLHGSNTAKPLIDEISLFSDSLGSRINDLDPDLLIPRGDGLRKDIIAYRARDDFSVLPPIPDDLMLGLEKIVTGYNSYVAFDPELALRDEALLGPDARKRIVPPAEGQAAVQDAVRRRAAQQIVVDVLSEDAKVAPDIPNPESRESRRYSEGVKNFARKAIELSVSFVQAAWRGGKYVLASGGVGYAAAQWVLANQQWLLTYFAENPMMMSIINDLLRILRALPLGS